MNRLIPIMLCAALLAGCLSIAGCSGSGDEYTDNASTTGVPFIVDAAGQQHEIPENNETITLAGVYAVSVPFISALNLSGRTLAITVKSKFWTDSDAGLAAAGSVGRGTNIDMEALAALSPDVFLHRSNDMPTVEAITDTLGIPVICVEVENYDDIFNTLEMMGAYFGAEARAREVSGWLKGKFEKIDNIVNEIPQEERVTALMLGSLPYRIAGEDMIQTWMIEKAGGISQVSGIVNDRSWINVGLETVFSMNPDIIFCTSSTTLDYKIDDLYQDSAWSAMTAVINRNIFEIPAKIDSWDMPGLSAALAVMYMLHKMYPAYFGEQELMREIDDYYTFFFGKTFDYSYLGIDLES